jgi:hypothetical protein
VVGISEGLQGSSLNAGNYSSSRRRLSDITMRPLWRSAAGSLESLVNVPPGAELWYDARDVAALQDDESDKSKIQQQQSQALKTLLDAGFDADASLDAIVTDDFSLLRGKHTGLFSVQLQPPGTTDPAATSEDTTGDASGNGTKSPDRVPAPGGK